MIKISNLSLIVTPEQFFSTDKVLFVDVLEYDKREIGVDFVLALKEKVGAFEIRDSPSKIYYTFIMKGSPENMFRNAKGPIQFSINAEYKGVYQWSNNLPLALMHKQFYDYSNHYSIREKNIPIDWNVAEAEFLYRRYIKQEL